MLTVAIVHPDPDRRTELAGVLSADDEIEVATVSGRPENLFERIVTVDPDVLLLGVSFEKISGLDLLYLLMQRDPLPVLMLAGDSAEEREEAMNALSYGAVDILTPGNTPEEICGLVKTAGDSRVAEIVRAEGPTIEAPDVSEKIVVIGASTGGPAAVEAILSDLPADLPSPVVVVQHMPPGYTPLFAEHLADATALRVVEVTQRERVDAGAVYLASGDADLVLERDAADVWAVPAEREGAAPSIDRTFDSVSNIYGPNTIGIILSGMGRDGVIGARYVKSRGGTVLVQDRDTSLIFGIGEHVVRQGDADDVLPLNRIAAQIVEEL